MSDKPKNKDAQRLGRRAKGVPKTLSDAERARRADWARGLAKRRKKKLTTAPGCA